MNKFFKILAVLAVITPFQSAVANNFKDKIIPHKALYDMKLTSVQSGSPITGVRGDMFFRLDDACDAWSTDHRFSTEYQYSAKPSVIVNSNFVAWENKDGKEFHFTSDTLVNGMASEKIRGSAKLNEDGSGVATYMKPEEIKHKMDKGFFFPTAHTADMIENAIKGKNFFNVRMFDGSDKDGEIEVSTFIGKEIDLSDKYKGMKDIDLKLLKGRAWESRLAFYGLTDDKKNNAEPLYQMSFVLHENGVVSSAVVEYKNFSVENKLKALEKLDPEKCK